MGFFTDTLELLEHFDKAPLRMHMERIEATRFIGADGKEYVRFPKPNYFKQDEDK